MIDVTPWQFAQGGAGLLPVDETLNTRATRFCRHFLVGDFDPRQYQRIWVAQEGERVVGVTGLQDVWDVSVFSSIDERASDAMAIRLNAHFADHGMRGHTVLVALPGDQPCPQMWHPEPAERYSATIR